MLTGVKHGLCPFVCQRELCMQKENSSNLSEVIVLEVL